MTRIGIPETKIMEATLTGINLALKAVTNVMNMGKVIHTAQAAMEDTMKVTLILEISEAIATQETLTEEVRGTTREECMAREAIMGRDILAAAHLITVIAISTTEIIRAWDVVDTPTAEHA